MIPSLGFLIERGNKTSSVRRAQVRSENLSQGS
jgi:hypothetical protein